MAITVVLPKSNSTRKFKITASNGTSRVMAYAPRTVTINETAKIGTIDRPGRTPIVRHVGPEAKKISMTQTVANVDWQKDILGDLAWLRNCAYHGYRIKFSGLSSFENGIWWHITSQSIEVEQRATNNEPSRAKVKWSLIEAQDVTVTAGKAAPKPAPKKKVVKKVKKPVQRTYKVKKGDNLWNISKKYLGKATRWPEIYKLNKGKGKNQIKNPNLIYPNQVFKLPPK